MAELNIWKEPMSKESLNSNGAPRKGAMRGFATMDPEKQRMIASKGGKMAHMAGRAHRFTSEEARVAGQKGGKIVSQDRDHMRSIGREGGIQRALHLVKNPIAQRPQETLHETNIPTKLAS